MLYAPMLDDAREAITMEVFFAMRQAFFYMAALQGRYAIHSASICYQGRGYLFSGPSGMGKSTQANLWKSCYRVSIWNGDVNLISLESDGPRLWGVPWNGTSGIYTRGSIPLGGLIFLRQSLKNQVVIPSASDRMVATIQRLISPTYTPELFEKALDVCQLLQEQIPMWRLYCDTTTEAAQVMKEAIDESFEKNL